jgi:hypothetical protein
VSGILARHRLLDGPAGGGQGFAARQNVVRAWQSDGGNRLLVRTDGALDPLPPGWQERPLSLEELAMSYLHEPRPEPSEATTKRRHTTHFTTSRLK